MDTGNSQDWKGRDNAISHEHWQFTWLQGKGEGHILWTLAIHRTAREGRGPSFMDTDNSQDCKGRDKAIFHGHWRFKWLQEKGEGHLSLTLAIHRTPGEERGRSFIDTDDLHGYRGRERAIFHRHWQFTRLQGKGEGYLSWTLMIYMTRGEGSGPSFMDTDNSRDYSGKERVIFHGHWWFTGLQGKVEGCLS